MTLRSKIPVTVKNTQLLRSMARRRGIVLRTRSREMASSSVPLSNRSEAHGGRLAKARGGHASEPVSPKDPNIPQVEDPDKPSTSLKWIPGITRWYWRIRGKARLWARALFPKPTMEQLEEKQYQQEEKLKDEAANRLGRKFGRLVTIRMCQLANADYLTLAHAKGQLVHWLKPTRDQAFTELRLRMDVDPVRVPPYVILTTLPKNSRLTDDLSALIGHHVRWEVGLDGVTLVITMTEEKPDRKHVTVEDLLKNEDPD